MRRPDPAKQCLWLGPGKYRGCGRNTAPNSNCFADPCIQRYSVRGNNANPYSHRVCDPHCNTEGVVVGVTVGVALAVGVGVGVVTPHGVALDTGVGETVGVGGGVPTAAAIFTRPQP